MSAKWRHNLVLRKPDCRPRNNVKCVTEPAVSKLILNLCTLDALILKPEDKLWRRITKINTRSNVIPALIIRLAILNLITTINKYRNQREAYICKGRLFVQFSVIICLPVVYLTTMSSAPNIYSVGQWPNWRLGRLTVQVSASLSLSFTHTRTHTKQTHTYTQYVSSERVISPSQRPLPTKQTQQTNIHALSGIRTSDRNNRAVSDLPKL